MTMRFRGSTVSEGFARGEAYIITSGEIRVPQARVEGETRIREEVQRLERAVGQVKRDLAELEVATRSKLKEASAVVSSLVTMLEDEVGLIEPIRALIRSGQEAASAVFDHFAQLIAQWRQLPPPLPSRVPDLHDLERRLVSRLMGRRWSTDLGRLPRRVIIVAEDLTPTQTASLDKDKVLAFVTDRGGPASHTAILARHLGIPAVVGLGNLSEHARQGDPILVDALAGEVILEPESADIRRYSLRQRSLQQRVRKLRLDEVPARTRDRAQIQILGNIDAGEGARDLLDIGVRGVGLFRTEYLYLGREDAPDEQVQVEHYRQLLEAMSPDPVAIRTFDFGADKFDHRVGILPEANPFLGMRSIRLSFARLELFRAQLRAICRASVVGNARIMFPMITDLDEFRRAKQVLHEVMEELRDAGIPFDESMLVGAMVEVPAAALTAPNLLREADFLSIGTNDLVQYTLAVDRTNAQVAHLFQPSHPSVLRLMKMTIDAAHRARKPVSACGEMAGSKRHIPVLLGLGLTALSMSATRVADAVESIRNVRLQECEDLAVAMMTSDHAAEAEAHLDTFFQRPSLRGRRGF
jgi:phosphotransferase system enzyme I (PtsI)